MAEFPHDVILKIVHDVTCDSSVAAAAMGDMAVGIVLDAACRHDVW